MTPNERADRAKLLLNDQVLNEALDSIRMGLVTRLEASPMGDVDTHHEAALSLQILKQIRTQLQRFIQDAAFEQNREHSERFIDRLRQKVRP